MYIKYVLWFSSWKRAWPFIRIKNSLYPGMLSDKFGWNWPNGSGDVVNVFITVKSSLFVRDQCSWITRITHTNEFMFQQTYIYRYDKEMNRLTFFSNKPWLEIHVPTNQQNVENPRTKLIPRYLPLEKSVVPHLYQCLFSSLKDALCQFLLILV